jgi:hypothetical protein
MTIHKARFRFELSVPTDLVGGMDWWRRKPGLKLAGDRPGISMFGKNAPMAHLATIAVKLPITMIGPQWCAIAQLYLRRLGVLAPWQQKLAMLAWMSNYLGLIP